MSFTAFFKWLPAAALLIVGLLPHPLSGQIDWDPAVGWYPSGTDPIVGSESLRSLDGYQAMTTARKAEESGRKGRAIRYYKKVIKKSGTSIFAPEARFRSAQLHIDRKQWPKAFEDLQAIVDLHPDYADFEAVIDDQFQIADGLRKGNRLRLFWRIPGFKSKERAIEYFMKVTDNAPFGETAPLALLHAANLQAKNRSKTEEAIDFYDRFINEYPDHELIADAYFGLADTFSSQMRGAAYDQGSNREAIDYFEDFALLYPDHERAAEAEERVEEMSETIAQSRILLGDFYSRYRKNHQAARVFYNEAITAAPRSPTADRARERLSRMGGAEVKESNE